jgi:hypothetical protein
MCVCVCGGGGAVHVLQRRQSQLYYKEASGGPAVLWDPHKEVSGAPPVTRLTSNKQSSCVEIKLIKLFLSLRSHFAGSSVHLDMLICTGGANIGGDSIGLH